MAVVLLAYCPGNAKATYVELVCRSGDVSSGGGTETQTICAWEQTGEWGGGGTSGSGTAAGGTVATASLACLNLKTVNTLPKGCSRTSADGPLPVPSFALPGTMAGMLYSPPGSKPSRLQVVESKARQDLGVCYADFSAQPDDCEAYYINSLNAVSASLSPGAREEWGDGVQELIDKTFYAQLLRDTAGLIETSAVGFSFWVSFTFNETAKWVMSKNDFNAALIAAKAKSSCKAWYEVWDKNGCI